MRPRSHLTLSLTFHLLHYTSVPGRDDDGTKHPLLLTSPPPHNTHPHPHTHSHTLNTRPASTAFGDTPRSIHIYINTGCLIKFQRLYCCNSTGEKFRKKQELCETNCSRAYYCIQIFQMLLNVSLKTKEARLQSEKIIPLKCKPEFFSG